MKKNITEVDLIIGHNLKRLRTEKNWSQEILANKLNTVKQKISGYETGRVGIGKDVLSRLCKVFNTHYFEFFIEPEAPLPSSDLQYKALQLVKDFEMKHADKVAEEMVEYFTFKLEQIKAPGAGQKKKKTA